MALANVNSPFGFTLFRSGGKADPRRTTRNVAADRANTLMIGDSYKDAGDGTVIRSTAATDTILGVVEGIILNPIAASPQGPVSQDYLPAADAGQIIGIEDADAEFSVQIDTMADPGDLGKTVAVVDAAGNVPLRRSRQSVTLDAVNKQFILLSLQEDVFSNSAGAFAKVIVRLATTVQSQP